MDQHLNIRNLSFNQLSLSMMLKLILTLLVAQLCLACANDGGIGESSSLSGSRTALSGTAGKSDADKQPIAIFLTSHGDIDQYEEIEPYIRSAFLKNVGVPLPKTLRELLQDPAYWLSKDLIEGQYELIGPTNYRANAQLQIDALQAELDRKGVPAKVYIGYNFMPPFIEDTAAQMEADGVEEIIVFNKGAQYSLATLGESIEELEHYLEKRPEWDVKVTAVRQFSDDPRFIDLYVKTLKAELDEYFPNVPDQDRCVLIASHGLPTRLINMGDPAVDQMLNTFEVLKERISESPLYHGFLNDDFFPGAEWVSPSAPDTAHEMRSVSCPAVLMDARLSFTTHHRATLYDLDIDVRSILEEPDLQPNGEVHPLYNSPKVVFANQWDGDLGFAQLLANLSVEALKGQGDLIFVQ